MKLPNSTSKDKLPRSRALAAKLVFAALEILKEKGGQAPGRDVVAEVPWQDPAQVVHDVELLGLPPQAAALGASQRRMTNSQNSVTTGRAAKIVDQTFDQRMVLSRGSRRC